jgi:U3 small nucleolar RNA-associated protein 14
MIRLAIRRVKPDEERNLRKWMAELKERRDGPILIYAMEAADHDRASAAFRNSTLPIEEQHKRVMQQVLADKIDAELLYECSLVQ